jgi:hypothetical protein
MSLALVKLDSSVLDLSSGRTIMFKLFISIFVCLVTCGAWAESGPIAVGLNLEQAVNTQASTTQYGLDFTSPSFDSWGWEQDPGSTKEGCSDLVVGNTPRKCAATSSSFLINGERQFAFNFNGGWTGERWHIDFSNQTLSYQNYIYDTMVYIDNPDGLWAAEFDLNVTSHGATELFGVQCNFGVGTWDYTKNVKGSPAWTHSNIPCNTSVLTPRTWLHLMIAYSTDSLGQITYKSITVGNKTSTFENATSSGPFTLGWSDGLLVNYQMDNNADKLQSGSITTFLKNLNVWAW